MTWMISKVSIIKVCLNNHFGTTKVSSERETEEAYDVHVSKLKRDESSNNVISASSYRAPATSTTKLNISVSNEEGFKYLHNGNERSNVLKQMLEATAKDQNDILKESLESVYRKLEEIEQNNAKQFRKITEQNKEHNKETEQHVDKSLKEMKETMKLQHRETRRRLDKCEEKTNPGIFN